MLIIAHRGASGEFPENSLLAFEQAILQQADGIELDVQYHHASQTFIVLHDHYLDKVSANLGHFNDFHLAQLSQLPIGQEQYLITLAQALELIGGRCLVNIEIKSSATTPDDLFQQLKVLEQTLDYAVNENSFNSQQFIISSFNHVFIAQCKQALPDIATGALIAHIPFNFASFTRELACDYLNLDVSFINQSLITDAHQHGLKVWVYTVDRTQEIKHCQALAVDAIFTNFPLRSRQRMTA
ncbi:glycerophosphoryl diester phosphodiesterase [Thalassotalea insulae]|uniref:Glycerophosphoryl diester phosphodiesterase n=1 Tax=Thalassotalea insulae TaxID=2056778 RepID=A0ABQ6GQF4_9GAMM|nr:glycerophosphodiester phosphodiesterase [Thalassotalea insulae]GLX78162.1 glycerophosphoryl diester phosphodiesterase [Thalassotalea insulae]